MTEYMNWFNKSQERSVKSELDYNDTKSVQNIWMRRKKFVPPEKEEIWRQRLQLWDMGLLSNASRTASSYYKSGMSVTSAKSKISQARAIMEDLYYGVTKVNEKEISIKEAEQRK